MMLSPVCIFDAIRITKALWGGVKFVITKQKGLKHIIPDVVSYAHSVEIL